MEMRGGAGAGATMQAAAVETRKAVGGSTSR